jgi:hypothetical protein
VVLACKAVTTMRTWAVQAAIVPLLGFLFFQGHATAQCPAVGVAATCDVIVTITDSGFVLQRDVRIFRLYVVLTKEVKGRALFICQYMSGLHC